MNKICAFAPATMANLSVGFDVLGMALNSIGDKVEVTFNGTAENRITAIVNGDNLPRDPAKNCCSVVIQKMQQMLQEKRGVDIRIYKGFQPGSGLGSSSASSAAAAFAYNKLIGNPFPEKALVAFAAEGERIACGSAHADNVAPAILGGLVLIKDHEKQEFVSLPLPENLHVVLFFPEININTADSREIMQEEISLKAATQQWGNLAAFVSSLYTNDLDLFSRSMNDQIAEPVRSLLIPKFKELKVAALQQGALSFGISGSGPTLFAFTNSEQKAKRVQEAMQWVYAPTQIPVFSFIESCQNNLGARICSSF